MRVENLLLMSLQNLKRNIKRVLLSSLGVIFGLATLIFFFSLTNGVRGLIFEHFLEELPADQIKVTPAYKPNVLAAFGKLSAKMFGGRSEDEGMDDEAFDDAAISEIEGIEGVESVYGVMLIKAPSYLYIMQRYSGANSRIVCAGIDDSVVKDVLPPDVSWSAELEDDEIPALLNPLLLSGWNEAFSSSFDMPKLDEEAVKTLPFFLEISPRDGPEREYTLKIVGLSTRAPIFGPLIPSDLVKQINQEINPDYENRYATLYITATSPTYVPELEMEIKNLGYYIAEEQEVAKQINFAFDIITIFLTAISLVIISISLVNIFNIFLINVMERKYEIGVMRAVGATRWDIRAIFLAESAIVGLANGLLGAVLGVGTALIMNPILKLLLGDVITSDFSVVVLNPFLLVMVVVFTPVVSMLAAFQPANYAAGLDPVEALRK